VHGGDAQAGVLAGVHVERDLLDPAGAMHVVFHI
jgi:hypothetical protein